MTDPSAEWHVYMLRCSDDSYYTGITTNLERRIEEHNSSTKAAKYTRARRPVELAYSERLGDRSSASKREAEIKRYSRKKKQQLAQSAS